MELSCFSDTGARAIRVLKEGIICFIRILLVFPNKIKYFV